MHPQIRAWQDRINRRCDAIADGLNPAIDVRSAEGGNHEVEPRDKSELGPASGNGQAAEAGHGIEYDFTYGAERVTLRQPGEPLPEPRRPLPGSLNDDAAVVQLASALKTVDAAYLDFATPSNSHVRLRTYLCAGLKALVLDLADRGRLDMLDRHAVEAERQRRSAFGQAATTMDATAAERVPEILDRADDRIATGAEIFIDQPWRLDRLMGGLFTPSPGEGLADWPLEQLAGFLDHRLAIMRDLGRRQAFGYDGNKLLALEQAVRATAIARAAGGWAAARQAQQRRALPLAAAEG